jgi:t-SNARE complex subunit (syntaxin)
MDGTPAAKAKLESREASAARAARAKALLYWTLAIFILVPWLVFIFRSVHRR